jgi:hypothetical protein
MVTENSGYDKRADRKFRFNGRLYEVREVDNRRQKRH